MTVPKSISIIPTSKSKHNLFLNYLDQNNTVLKSTSRYDINQTTEDVFNEKYWTQMFPNAAYFHMNNPVLGDVFAMIYNSNLKNSQTHTLASFIIAKHGCSVHPIIDISPETRYYPAIENLSDIHRSSKVRKALAVSLLKTFADLTETTTKTLYNQANFSEKTFDWDETQAGILASEMKLLDTRPPDILGSYLYELGYLTSNLSTSSYIVDVLYKDTEDTQLTDKNNNLAFMLGKQLDTLFDPLTEYSPEPTEKVYKVPSTNDTKLEDSDLITSICEELISVQTNYTVLLVQFLQNFIVPLRTQVLDNKLPGFTMNQINQIFPPTIDEVTRINCIFLDMLKLAQPFGSYEILKACGTTIPYFYKAQMRHEAAIKNFHANLSEFKTKISGMGRSDLLSFDQRTIETSIYSSLNLVKIQLIIQRLVKNRDWPVNLKQQVKLYAESCDNTISSFARDKLKPYNGRVFTPTGKIITELAKGWPAELQFGWLTRRVVAVFDATDLLVSGVKNRAVVIIFSDHVLFLSIDDDSYYANYWDENQIHKPSISDVLIHSLTNETPLNKIPNMTVRSWASINDINAFHYTSSIDNPKSFVRFFNEKVNDFTGVYQLDKVSGKYVTEVIARSKILNKSQSFHLFCGSVDDENENRKVYYTAHESQVYQSEETKSPFIVLFNQKFDITLLDEYDVYAFITLNFIDESSVRLEGISRCQFDDSGDNGKFSYDINLNIFSDSLSLILSELFTTHMSLYNPEKIDYILVNNGEVNNRAFKTLQVSTDQLEMEKSKITDSIKKMQREREIIKNVSNSRINQNKSLDELSRTEGVSGQPKDVKKKKSGFFGLFKSKKSGTANDVTVSSKLGKPERKPSVIQQRISSIRRPKDIDYNELKPAQPKHTRPKKRPSHTFAIFNAGKSVEPSLPSSGTVDDDDDDGEFSGKKDSETTVSTGIYVNSHFEFPMEAGVEDLTTPRYGKLKNEPGHKKGYKDSVDLMCAFESPVKKEHVKESYDDDLFELNKKEENDVLVLPVAKNPNFNSPSPMTTPVLPPVESMLNPFVEPRVESPWRAIGRPQEMTPPTTPKMVGSPVFMRQPITPHTPRNDNENDSWTSPRREVKSPSPDGKINNMKRKAKVSEVHKSTSFYQRFKKLRDDQEVQLRKYGICRVVDVSKLSLADQTVLKSGFVVVDDVEDVDVDVVAEDVEAEDEDKEEVVDSLVDETPVDRGFRVKVIDSKVVHRSPQRYVSTTSSVYASTVDELGAVDDVESEVEEDLLGMELDMRDMSMISFSQLTLGGDREDDDSVDAVDVVGAVDVDTSLMRDESYTYLNDMLHAKIPRDKTEYDIVLKRGLVDSKSVGWLGKFVGE